MALNFVISYMYNKLPRRRVNIFGEELEKALKEKFEGHWYPSKPMKGSAYRCLKTGDPIDPVLEKAAREAGMELREITENLPEDLAVWIDPGEVSYRIGEKGLIKVLYSEAAECATQEENLDKEVTKTFNPEAQCFRPIDAISSSLSLSPKSSTPSPTPPFKTRETSPAFMPPKSSAPLTFTIASFAQTKFGSTKLKTSTKRANRMSPTEFSHYIKQRQIIQQQQQQQQHQIPSFGNQPQQQQQQQQQFTTSRPRSLSPNPMDFYFPSSAAAPGYNPWGRGVFDVQTNFTDLNQSFNPPKYPVYEQTGPTPLSNGQPATEKSSDNVIYSSQYQHLLVAN